METRAVAMVVLPEEVGPERARRRGGKVVGCEGVIFGTLVPRLRAMCTRRWLDAKKIGW